MAPEVRAEGGARPFWLATFLYFALTVVCTWPLARHFGTGTFPLGTDTDLFAWTLAWDAHAMVTHPLSIFDANIYYPEPNTLAYSENLIGSAILAAPVIWLTGNLTAALNFVMLASCVLCGVGGYVLGRRVGMRPLGALVTGLVFAFSPPRFFRLSQPHLNAVQWMPFTVAFLHAYLDGGRRRHLWLAAGCFSLQALASGHGAVLLTLTLAAFLAWRLALGGRVRPVKWLRDLGVPGLLLLAPAVLVVLPYRSVQQAAGLRRVVGAQWGSWESFLQSPAFVHQFLISLVPGLQIINERAEGALFPGIGALLLAVVALWPRRRSLAVDERGSDALAARGDGRGRWRTGAWRLLAAAADIALLAGVAGLAYIAVNGPFRFRWGRTVVLSAHSPWRLALTALGGAAVRWSIRQQAPFAVVRWLRSARESPGLRARVSAAVSRWRDAHRSAPAPLYAMLTILSLAVAAPAPLGLWPYVHALPGFSLLRVPARFTVVTVLGLSVLAGLGFERLAGRLSARRRAVAALAAAALIAGECLMIPLDIRPWAVEIPRIDRWLDGLPKPFAVAEFPVPASRGTGVFERFQGRYMLHSTAHWQKTIHGFSGHRTALHEQLYDRLATFPDQAGLRRLEELKVTYLVVHTDYYPPGGWEEAEPRFAALGDRLRLLHVEGAGRVYELRR